MWPEEIAGESSINDKQLVTSEKVMSILIIVACRGAAVQRVSCARVYSSSSSSSLLLLSLGAVGGQRVLDPTLRQGMKQQILPA